MTLFGFDFIVAGRVQGVFFRKATQRNATSLGLGGWVRNDPADTSRVEGHARGSSSALSQFREWLQTGPAGARVDSVSILNEGPCSGGNNHLAFEIRR